MPITLHAIHRETYVNGSSRYNITSKNILPPRLVDENPENVLGAFL